MLIPRFHGCVGLGVVVVIRPTFASGKQSLMALRRPFAQSTPGSLKKYGHPDGYESRDILVFEAA